VNHSVTYRVGGATGWDAVLSALLPAKVFARHVARKLLGDGGPYASWDFAGPDQLMVELPNGTTWRVINRDGHVAPTSSQTKGVG
jgi:hypothetical protein